MKLWNSRTQDWLSSTGNLIAMFVILILLALIAFGASKLFGPLTEGEIQIGMVVVFSIVALLAMLNVTVAMFSGLHLTSPQDALGLPNGSVRALIALFLIMIFIIMSVYLFRSISGRSGAQLLGLTASQVAALQGQIFNIAQKNDNTFDVTLRVGVPAAAEQLALQLITILGTLVTAVSAFYFGSSTAAAKQDVAPREIVAQEHLSIDKITPASVAITAVGSESKITVLGTGFVSGAQVKLTNPAAAQERTAANVSVDNPSQITCTFDLQEAPAGKWNLVVVNPDGGLASKKGLFEITDL